MLAEEAFPDVDGAARAASLQPLSHDLAAFRQEQAALLARLALFEGERAVEISSRIGEHTVIVP